MPSDTPPARRAPAPLAYRIDEASSAVQIAAVCGTLWQELDAALSPIIGGRGVAALGLRSLHLAGAQHPWLLEQLPGGPAALDSVWLVTLLGQRSRADAIAAGGAFFQTFRNLLSSLIGESLTEQLLRSVWGPPDTPLNCAQAQDPSP